MVHLRKTQLSRWKTPAVNYCVGNQRVLHWKKRDKSVAGVWKDNGWFGTLYYLNSDTATILTILHEDTLSEKNIGEDAQYQHGGVNVKGTKLCVGLVFRVAATK